MLRRLIDITAVLSLVIIIALSAGWLWALRQGLWEAANVGQWHLWIANDGQVVLADFGPESDALLPATAYVNLQWVIGPLGFYVLAWGAFSIVRLRRRRRVRGFPVEPVEPIRE